MHVTTCFDAERRGVPMVPVKQATRDRKGHPLWPVFHRDCMGRYTWDMPTVRLEEADMEPHKYEVSMIWPAGEKRALCLKCHTNGPHLGEKQ